MRALVIRTIATVALAVSVAGCRLTGEQAATADSAAVTARCRDELAQRFTVPAAEIRVIEAQATTWPDSALGMPEPGRMYAQVATPGWRVVLEARNVRYLYTADGQTCRYGGPLALWSSSLLYLVPVPNEPNLNGDLYQCSLLGTHHVRLASRVAAYYPQERGAVLFTRRLSRSSQELLFAAGGAETTLYRAFTFGAAALNSAQDSWAGCVRPGIGSAWSLVVAYRDRVDTAPRTVPLPDGVRPERVTWEGNRVLILTSRGDRPACFAITPRGAAPAWQEVATANFPGLPPYLLNKSETLRVDQLTEDGATRVEVARVWFTGDRNVLATLHGFTLRGYALLPTGYLFLHGEDGGTPAAYTLHLATGAIAATARGAFQDIKPFHHPPVSRP